MSKEINYDIQAPVFNMQTYSIHDGPGIRTTVFVKGCPLRCLWCANPESNAAKPELMTYISKCTGCGRCVEACPRKAIRLSVEGEKVHEVTDRSICVNCGKCVEACFNNAREIAGKPTTVRQALDKVKKDKIFYDASGGGMTISGGEALVYPDFCENLYRACHEEGIHTAIESCSYASREAVDQVFPHVDLALLDVKHMFPIQHKKLTGVSNEKILANIIHVKKELHVPVIVRFPVIPGYNDEESNVWATIRFAAEQLDGAPIHFLPYHRLGESKSESLGRPQELGIDPPPEEKMKQYVTWANEAGLEAQIGG